MGTKTQRPVAAPIVGLPPDTMRHPSNHRPSPHDTTHTHAHRPTSQGFLRRHARLLILLFLTCLATAFVSTLRRAVATVDFALADAWCAARTAAGLSIVAPSDWLEATPAAKRQPSPYFSPAYNQSMFWGTYRPHLYFGVRSREPQALLFGLAWWDGRGMSPVRHTTADGESVTFLWEVHDGRTYGRQTITDRDNGLSLTVYFMKAADGEGWSADVHCVRHLHSDHPVALAMYFVSEDAGLKNGEGFTLVTPMIVAPGWRGQIPKAATPVDSSHIQLSGTFLQGGQKRGFVATLVDDRPSPSHASSTPWYAMAATKKSQPWNIGNDLTHLQTKGSFPGAQTPRNVSSFPSSSSLTNGGSGGGTFPPAQNVALVMKSFTDGFRVRVEFRGGGKIVDGDTDDNAIGNQHSDDVLDGCVVRQLEAALEGRFKSRFATVFGIAAKLQSPPRANDEPSNRLSGVSAAAATRFEAMAAAALSNMLGGLGYWHGHYHIACDPATDATCPPARRFHASQGPSSLFSCVPSRSKFPRGFLWDEGFHQLLVSKWDAEIAKDVISHWLIGAMDPASGWIPREQVLGPEPRTRIPAEFVPQHRTHANPPSLIIAVQNMAREGDGRISSGSTTQFLSSIAPRLRLWRDWLVATQCGGSCNETATSLSFRWRSRNGYHLLASGLDDYPRLRRCPEEAERHVDLFSWVHLMTSTLSDIERAMGVHRDDPLSAANWGPRLTAQHWDAAAGRFSDNCVGRGFAPYEGYVNLFPLLTGTIEDPEQARAVLRMARAQLWSGYGLQSVSNATRRSIPTGQHDDYWTGPIWINVNFLMLRALRQKYVPMLGLEARNFYDDLRADVVTNIAKEYARTGRLWENYDRSTGQGRGTAPFTGWTALVTLVLAEDY